MRDSMHELTVPKYPELHQALGRLAIAHTHLELVLRYCVKTLAGLEVTEALDATSSLRASDVRRQVRRLFKEKEPLPSEEARLGAMLGAAHRLSEKRNIYLHSAWSQTEAGQAVRRGDDYQWERVPSETEVDRVASEILALGKQINDERCHGFISEVVGRYKRE